MDKYKCIKSFDTHHLNKYCEAGVAFNLGDTFEKIKTYPCIHKEEMVETNFVELKNVKTLVTAYVHEDDMVNFEVLND